MVAVAGRPTADSREVQHAVLEQKVGDTVKLTVWREGKQMEVDVRTAELPNEANTANNGENPQGSLGLELQTLTPDMARQLGVDRNTKGAAVTRISPDGVAAQAGLRPGDVIVGVDQSPVTNAEQAASRLKQPHEGGHLARVLREGRAMFVVIPNPK